MILPIQHNQPMIKSPTRLYALMALCGWMILAGTAINAYAQPGVRVGAKIDYEFGVPLGLNRNPGAVDWCRCNGDGSSFSHATWLGAQLSGLFEGPFDIVQRLSLAYAWGTFTSDPYAIPFSNDTAQQTARFTVTNTAWYAAEELALRWRPGSAFSIELGPALLYRINGTYTQAERIVEPAGSNFLGTDSPERTIRGGDELAGPRLRAAGVLGAAYAIPIDSAATMVVEPTAHARFDFEGLRLGLGLRAISAIAGVSLQFGLPAARPIQAPPRVDTLYTNLATNAFAATVDIYATIGTGTPSQQYTVRFRNRPVRYIAPIHNAVAFEEHSAAFPLWYTRLDSASAASFTSNSLARPNKTDIEAHMLNIIGMRMRDDADLSLSLLGHITPREPRGMANARVATVREYLERVWGIAPQRISAVSEPQAANGRRQDEMSQPTVELFVRSSRSQAPLPIEPVSVAWEEQEVDAPQIGVRPTFSGGGGMRHWEITVRHLGREVMHCSSDGVQENHDLGIRLHSDSLSNSATIPPLVAELIAEDSAGVLAVARDRMPIVIDTSMQSSASPQTICIVPVVRLTPDADMLQRVMTLVRPHHDILVTFDDPAVADAARTIAEALHDVGRTVSIENASATTSSQMPPSVGLRAVSGIPVTVILSEPPSDHP